MPILKPAQNWRSSILGLSEARLLLRMNSNGFASIPFRAPEVMSIRHARAASSPAESLAI